MRPHPACAAPLHLNLLPRSPVLPHTAQVGLVSFFLPFFPLERRHIAQLFALRLADRGGELARGGLGALHWDADVIEFLTSKVCLCACGRVHLCLAAPVSGPERAAARPAVAMRQGAPPLRSSAQP